MVLRWSETPTELWERLEREPYYFPYGIPSNWLYGDMAGHLCSDID